MIVKAITENNYQWLLFVWAFDKNYLGPKTKAHAVQLTFQNLFETMRKQYSDQKELELRVKGVVEWRIINNDNILIALLSEHFDGLAVSYMGLFSHLLD